jgi:hypothetical protein
MECVSGWICNALRRTSFKEDFYYWLHHILWTLKLLLLNRYRVIKANSDPNQHWISELVGLIQVVVLIAWITCCLEAEYFFSTHYSIFVHFYHFCINEILCTWVCLCPCKEIIYLISGSSKSAFLSDIFLSLLHTSEWPCCFYLFQWFLNLIGLLLSGHDVSNPRLSGFSCRLSEINLTSAPYIPMKCQAYLCKVVVGSRLQPPHNLIGDIVVLVSANSMQCICAMHIYRCSCIVIRCFWIKFMLIL